MTSKIPKIIKKIVRNFPHRNSIFVSKHQTYILLVLPSIGKKRVEMEKKKAPQKKAKKKKKAPGKGGMKAEESEFPSREEHKRAAGSGAEDQQSEHEEEEDERESADRPCVTGNRSAFCLSSPLCASSAVCEMALRSCDE